MDKLIGKTVLVTGATGLIGSKLVKELMKLKDVKVIALSRSLDKLYSCFHEYLDRPGFEIIAQDITKPLELIVPIDVIFHAAGPIAGNIVKERPVDVILPNLQGTRNCLEFLMKQEAEIDKKGRLVIFSSATVYGNLSEHDKMVTETDTQIAGRLDDRSASYFETKRMVEVIAQSYCRQYGLDVVLARFAYVYGYTRHQPNTAFYEFIQKALQGENLVFLGSGFARRDNIYVDDAVAGILKVCTDGVQGEVYNISSCGEKDNFAAIDDMAEIIANVMNEKNRTGKKQIEVVYQNGKKDMRACGIRMDNSKLKQLGWNLSTSMSDGIRKTIEQSIQEK